MPVKRKKARASGDTTGKRKKQYTDERASKKPAWVWNHYKPLFSRLWVDYHYAVPDLQNYVRIKYGDDLSQRQIQHHMSTWGWRKYKIKKNNNEEGVEATEEGSLLGEAEDSPDPGTPQRYAPSPAPTPDFSQEMASPLTASRNCRPPAQNTRSMYSDDPNKMKADAFMAVGDPMTAFPVYAQFCEEAVRTPGVPSQPTGLILASCMQAASTIEERLTALRLIDYFQSDTRHGSALSLQLSLLKLHTGFQSEATDKVARAQALKSLLDHSPWLDTAPPFTVADLGTWRAIVQLLYPLQDKKHIIPRYDQRFILSQPANGGPATENKIDASKATALLHCLEWATERLLESANKPLSVPRFLEEVEADASNQHHVNHLILFLPLLAAAFNNQAELSWFHQSEPETSVPPVLLLSAVCHMVLSESPFDEGISLSIQTSLNLEPDLTLALRPTAALTEAVQVTKGRAPDHLWGAFLDKIFEEGDAGCLDDHLLTCVREYVDALFPPEMRRSPWDDRMSQWVDTVPLFGGPDARSEEDGWSEDPTFTHEFAGSSKDLFAHPLGSNFDIYPRS